MVLAPSVFPRQNTGRYEEGGGLIADTPSVAEGVATLNYSGHLRKALDVEARVALEALPEATALQLLDALTECAETLVDPSEWVKHQAATVTSVFMCRVQEPPLNMNLSKHHHE